MTDYSKDIALMFPATVTGGSETNVDTHVTSLYIGSVEDVPFTADQLVEALQPYLPLAVGAVFPRELELFGEEKDYLVVSVDDYQLDIVHSLVLNVVKQLGGKDASSYPDYKAHVTLQENFTGELDKQEIPTKITLGPLQLWWGNDKIDLDKD